MKYRLFSVITLALVALDQVTKWWVRGNIEYRLGEIDVIPGLLSLVHAQNSGAAFGILQGQMLVFAVFTVIAIGLLAHMLRSLGPNERFQTVALAMIASGAAGNAVDRVLFRSVTDFVRVYTDHPELKAWLLGTVGTYEWPSFNVADMGIVVGLGMFFVHYWVWERKEIKAAALKSNTTKE